MITIQFDDNKAHYSDIFYISDGENEKRIRVPLGKGKDIYVVIKREKDLNKPYQLGELG